MSNELDELSDEGEPGGYVKGGLRLHPHRALLAGGDECVDGGVVPAAGQQGRNHPVLELPALLNRNPPENPKINL